MIGNVWFLFKSHESAFALGTQKNLRIQWESFFYYFVYISNCAFRQLLLVSCHCMLNFLVGHLSMWIVLKIISVLLELFIWF
jgi:hypothetical protein